MQHGFLYKNVKVLTDHGYASSSTEVYWLLTRNNYIYVVTPTNETPKKLEKDDIYYFCISERYGVKKEEPENSI
jgi:hypothetical protein